MGFQKLQSIVSAAAATAPVTVRLTKRAAVVIHIKKSFIGGAADNALWTRADVSLGDGDDEGKLMIEPSASGLVAVAQLKHAVTINIGRIDGIGPGPSKSHPAVANIFCDNIVLTIPELPQVEIEEVESDEADDAGQDETEDDESDDADDAGTDAAPPPAAKGETFGGVTIDLSDGDESIMNRGVMVEVTKRQAKLVYLLAKNRTTGCTRGFLLNALWDGAPPSHASDTLDSIIHDIAEVLAAAKLAVVPKALGFKLVDL